MMIIYGSMLCKDCVACRESFDKAGVVYEFRDINCELQNLKDFLKLRDGNPLFDPIRACGGIGIPCLLEENGELTLDWEKYLSDSNT